MNSRRRIQNSRGILDHVIIVMFGVLIIMFSFSLFSGLERRVTKDPCEVLADRVVSELGEVHSSYSEFDRTEYVIDLPQGDYTILVKGNVVKCVSDAATVTRESNINMGNFNLREGRNTIIIENA